MVDCVPAQQRHRCPGPSAWVCGCQCLCLPMVSCMLLCRGCLPLLDCWLLQHPQQIMIPKLMAWKTLFGGNCFCNWTLCALACNSCAVFASRFFSSCDRYFPTNFLWYAHLSHRGTNASCNYFTGYDEKKPDRKWLQVLSPPSAPRC